MGRSAGVEQRIRRLVEEGGGRASVEVVVREGLGLTGAVGPLAQSLAESAVRELPGLAVVGSEVVARATPPQLEARRLVALAVAPPPNAAALPPMVAWTSVPAGIVSQLSLSGASARAATASLASELSGARVFALSAAVARRTLRLGAAFAGIAPEQEAEVVALGRVARVLGRPLADAEAAAALVGQAVPETPEGSCALVAAVVEHLADLAELPAGRLHEVEERDVLPEFDFGTRAFGRGEILGLPEAPGVYLFEDAEGSVLYVGKAQDLRRRVSSYFTPRADERAQRIRDEAHGLTVERTGSELTAVLREHELIRDLRPTLNVQEDVHSRGVRPSPLPGATGALGIVLPSAEGGVDVVVVDRERGIAVVAVVPEDAGPMREALEAALGELRRRKRLAAPPEVEVVLRWLSLRGAAASFVDVAGPLEASVDLLARLALDLDLGRGRIVPVV